MRDGQSIKALETRLNARLLAGTPQSSIQAPQTSVYRAEVTAADGGNYTVQIVGDSGALVGTAYELVRSFPPGTAYVPGDYVLIVFTEPNPQPVIVAGAGSGTGDTYQFITGPVWFSQ